ncbi:MAG TPA: hypothetical protein VE007_04780 [Thermoanaerobaculia bacterium]|nr:hypothetical protein [Thermoanaerobaculia bacterium]
MQAVLREVERFERRELPQPLGRGCERVAADVQAAKRAQAANPRRDLRQPASPEEDADEAPVLRPEAPAASCGLLELGQDLGIGRIELEAVARARAPLRQFWRMRVPGGPVTR